MVNQTSVIVFALLVGFVVFITVKGELAAYLWVLGLAGAPAPGGTSYADKIDQTLSQVTGRTVPVVPQR